MPVPAPQPPPEPEDPPKKKVTKKKAQAALTRMSPGKDVQRYEDAAIVGNHVIDLGLAGQGIFRMNLELDEIDSIRTRLQKKIERAEADEKDGKPLTVEQELQLAECRAVLVKLGMEGAHDLIKANPPQNPQGNKPASPWQPFPANVVVVQNANAPVEPKPIDS